MNQIPISSTSDIPKAELHCHLEGAAHPSLVQRQGEKYGVDTSHFIKNNAYVWHDFTSFLNAYDCTAMLFRTREDYALLAQTYLTSIALEGAIYGEFFVSPAHSESIGLNVDEYMAGISEGIQQAREKTGIEARIVVTGVRHLGADAIEKAAHYAVNCGNPLVTGFGVAGDERQGHPRDFVKAFDIARDGALGLTVHAGELVGYESVRDCLDYLRPSRIGHGVRSIENSDLVARIAGEGIVLECCPGSNIALKVFKDFQNHPLPALRDAGCIVTISSDDPPFFHTSLAREYDIAATYFDFSDEVLRELTRNSIRAAFVDEDTKSQLLERC